MACTLTIALFIAFILVLFTSLLASHGRLSLDFDGLPQLNSSS